jgi:branched-chain amino acid transport system ATP-binding protein
MNCSVERISRPASSLEPPRARSRRRLSLATSVKLGRMAACALSVPATPARSRARYAAAFAAFPLLEQRLRQRAGSLSGGERKLLSFARTLGLSAPLTLLDEPTEGVQPENIERMAGLLHQRRAAGASFVVVEQNLSFVEAVADEVLVLDHRRTVAAGALAALGRQAIEAHLAV